jgi:hypothetical protein
MQQDVRAAALPTQGDPPRRTSHWLQKRRGISQAR